VFESVLNELGGFLLSFSLFRRLLGADKYAVRLFIV
jgi:hypothetical protein